MRVSIDWNICAGAGLCAIAAPRVFEVVQTGDGRRRAVLVAAAPDAVLCDAAFACPTLAIQLFDDLGQAVYPPVPGR